MSKNHHKRGGSYKFHTRKKGKDSPYFGKELQNGLKVKKDLTSDFFIDYYMRKCRGLQKRNWTNVWRQLVYLKCPKDVIQVCYHSWVKFKFARMLRPRLSSTYVYIMKNCSTLIGQQIYDDCYEQFTEQPLETTRLFYERREKSPLYFRLMDYFYSEDPDWILPLSVFPRIDFEKSKMHLSSVPYQFDEELYKVVYEKVFNYVYSLDIKSLFIPRGDLLQKYSSQKYNDGGVVKFDYERPTNSFDSSFKYQRFLTQPLTPREVWLPGKAIKQNNAFMMNVHRQILRKEPVYPKDDMDHNHKVLAIALREGCWKFDISGFGFQFLRELLSAGNAAIRELYPCSEMEEQGEIMEQILKSVSVEMPNGEVVKPIRGIGLGYYEDLKTIIMLSILKEYYPISIYGDQGLIEKRGIEFAFALMDYSFIMNHEKIDEGASEGTIRFGGFVHNKDGYFKPRIYSDNIFGAFFSRHHWERKSTLYSISKHYPEMYKSVQKRLVFAYEKIFGYEFFKGELSQSFIDGGITTKERVTGVQRLYNIRAYQTPINTMVFDPVYQTPFNLINANTVTFKESKEFQLKRKRLYKENVPKDTHLYDYVNPVIEFNKKTNPIPRSLPRWADLNLILFSNQSSGSITCGLSREDIQKAAERQYFCSDPFRARATGGYSFVTKWRSSRPPSHELLESAEILQGCDNIDSLYVNRTDLIQNPMLSEDSMYYNDDLFKGVMEKVSKRKMNPSISGNSEEINRLADDVRQNLPSLIKRNKLTTFPDIIAYAEERLEEYDKGYTIAESDHGSLGADDLFFSDAIDMVDLS